MTDSNEKCSDLVVDVVPELEDGEIVSDNEEDGLISEQLSPNQQDVVEKNKFDVPFGNVSSDISMIPKEDGMFDCHETERYSKVIDWMPEPITQQDYQPAVKSFTMATSTPYLSNYRNKNDKNDTRFEKEGSWNSLDDFRKRRFRKNNKNSSSDNVNVENQTPTFPQKNSHQNRMLCKFHVMGCCSKKKHCQFMHSEFPCKHYYLGVNKGHDHTRCKLSHGKPLTSDLRAILLRHLESASNELLGDFPKYSPEKLLRKLNRRHKELELKYSGTAVDAPSSGRKYRSYVSDDEQSYAVHDSGRWSAAASNNDGIGHLSGAFEDELIAKLVSYGVDSMDKINQLTVAQLREFDISLIQIDQIQKKAFDNKAATASVTSVPLGCGDIDMRLGMLRNPPHLKRSYELSYSPIRDSDSGSKELQIDCSWDSPPKKTDYSGSYNQQHTHNIVPVTESWDASPDRTALPCYESALLIDESWKDSSSEYGDHNPPNLVDDEFADAQKLDEPIDDNVRFDIDDCRAADILSVSCERFSNAEVSPTPTVSSDGSVAIANAFSKKSLSFEEPSMILSSEVSQLATVACDRQPIPTAEVPTENVTSPLRTVIDSTDSTLSNEFQIPEESKILNGSQSPAESTMPNGLQIPDELTISIELQIPDESTIPSELQIPDESTIPSDDLHIPDASAISNECVTLDLAPVAKTPKRVHYMLPGKQTVCMATNEDPLEMVIKDIDSRTSNCPPPAAINLNRSVPAEIQASITVQSNVLPYVVREIYIPKSNFDLVRRPGIPSSEMKDPRLRRIFNIDPMTDTHLFTSAKLASKGKRSDPRLQCRSDPLAFVEIVHKNNQKIQSALFISKWYSQLSVQQQLLTSAQLDILRLKLYEYHSDLTAAKELDMSFIRQNVLMQQVLASLGLNVDADGLIHQLVCWDDNHTTYVFPSETRLMSLNNFSSAGSA